MRKVALLGIAVCALVVAALPRAARAAVEIETSASWSSAGNVDHYDVALGDADGDGDLDLAAYAADHVRLYRNSGGALETSPSWTSVEDPSGWGFLAWADADGDGDLDLFTSLGWYNNTGGTLAPTATFAPLALSDTFAVGDVNNDGRMDVLVGTSGRIDLYLNGPGGIDEASDWNTTDDNRPATIALGDVDKDGFREVAVGSGPFAARPVRVYDNVGGVLQSAATWTSTEDTIVNAVAFGDVEGDGYPDLLAVAGALGGDGPHRMYHNTGGTLSASATWLSATYSDGQDGTFADLDKDGDLDLVIASSPMIRVSDFEYVNGTEAVYWNEGGTVSTGRGWATFAQDITYQVDVGDVDGDGYPDIVAADVEDMMNTYRGRAILYRNLGPNQAPSVTDLTVSPETPRVNEVVTVTATATDPEDDYLEYAFDFDAGAQETASANVLRWRAPGQPGTYGITVNVTDRHGNYAERTVNVTVAEAAKDTSFFSLGNPILWLLIVVVLVAAGGGAAYAVHRRKAAATPAPAMTAGGAPLPPPPPPEPSAPGDRVAGIRDAYQKGYLPRNVYGENLARALAVPPSPQRDAILRAFGEGRIDEATLEENLRRMAAT